MDDEKEWELYNLKVFAILEDLNNNYEKKLISPEEIEKEFNNKE